jgi:hypothetical protein
VRSPPRQTAHRTGSSRRPRWSRHLFAELLVEQDRAGGLFQVGCGDLGFDGLDDIGLGKIGGAEGPQDIPQAEIAGLLLITMQMVADGKVKIFVELCPACFFGEIVVGGDYQYIIHTRTFRTFLETI